MAHAVPDRALRLLSIRDAPTTGASSEMTALPIRRRATTVLPRSPGRVAGTHSRGHRAINHHRLSTDELRVVAGQEQRHRRNVFGASRARPGLESRKELRNSLFAARNAVVSKRRRNKSRTDAIDANLVFGQFDRSRAGEADNSGLRSTVCVQASRATQSGDRGGRDDRTAACLPQFRHRVLDAEKYRAQQNREAAVRVFRAGLFERTDRATEAGVVVDDVEVSEFLDRAIDRALDIFLTRDVGELENCVAAVLFAFAYRALATFTIQIGDDDSGAFACEPYRGRAADSARRTCNNCNLLSSLLMCFSPFRAEVRLLGVLSRMNSLSQVRLPTARRGRAAEHFSRGGSEIIRPICRRLRLHHGNSLEA